jgi:hypothetical protein
MDITARVCGSLPGGMAVSSDGMVDSLTLPAFSCNLVDIGDGGE